MSKSITQQAIAMASKEVASRLASLGFRRKGVHLIRQSGDLFHAIHFQASQWGNAAEGKFTVNFIVASPTLYEEWYGMPFPANPASAPFPVHMRIGSLLPERCDYWWPVGQDADIAKIAVEVAATIERVSAGFFSTYESNEALLVQLRKGVCPGCTGPQAAVLHMLVAGSLGHRVEAEQACREALKASKVPAFSDRVLSHARKLGINVG